VRWFLPLLVLAACAAAPRPFPTDALLDLTYHGTQSGSVTLVDGLWQGAPFQEDATSQPEVSVAAGDPSLGDLDGDGHEDAVVVLAEVRGGSGIFVYFAAVTQADGRPSNVATVLLGDRVGVNRYAITDGRLEADLMVAGPNDSACCPKQKVRVRWALRDGRLQEESREDLGRVD